MTDVRQQVEPERTSARRQLSPSRVPRRMDIQGLRAFAVLAVVLDHTLGWPSGGFLGVDVFFVISGFLITGLMLVESERTGRISFSGFYRRRVKRILPAAMFVLASTVVMSHVVLIGTLARQATTDAFWAAVFMANWHFAAIGTDYFQSELPPSPIQHYWSLSVEEQFYVVWPALLFAILLLARRARDGRGLRWLPLAVTVVLAALSFGWALYATDQRETAAYFSTFTRAWELLVGAVLALLASRLSKQPTWCRAVTGWSGLLLMVGSVLLVTDASAVPAPAARPAVLGALLVLAAGIGAEDHRYLFLLSNRTAGFIGMISFSLYLWHWPVVVLLGNVIDDTTVWFKVLALTLTGVLSTATYYLVEYPVLASKWLNPRTSRGTRKGGLTAKYERRLRVGWVGAAAVASLALCGAAVAHVNEPPPETVATTSTLDEAAGKADETTPTATANPLLNALQEQIRTSIGMERFPDLKPGPDDFDAYPDGRVDWTTRPCVPDAPAGCEPGDGSAGTVAVLGDSMAGSWLPTIEKAVEPYGYAVDRLHRPACPIVETEVENESDGCADYREQTLALVAGSHPDVAVISDLYADLSILASGNQGDAAVNEWTQALNDTLDRVSAAADHVVVLSAPPESADPKECITKFTTPEKCETNISQAWRDARRAERAAVQGRPNVTYVDTSPWVCTTDEIPICPGFANGMAIRIDHYHMTQAYAEYLSPLLEQALQRTHILPATTG